MKKLHCIIVAFLLLVVSQTMFAQSDYNFYLQKAQQLLAEGNCDGAQKNYNVYMELAQMTNYDLEQAIEECNKSKDSKNSKEESQKSYNIGDNATDFIGYGGYKIAYLDASGKHGFAIKEDGESITTDTYNAPSIDELRIIYYNRYSLGLSGEYWSKTDANNINRRYTIDFSTGETHRRKWGSYWKYKNLKIVRF